MKLGFILIFTLALLSSCSTNNYRSAATRAPSAIESFSCRDIISHFTRAGHSFSASRKVFTKKVEKKFSKSKAKQIDNNLNALLFIDYTHSFDVLEQLYKQERTLDSVNIFDIYNSDRARPFQNFIKTSDYLQRYRPDFSVDSLKKVHKKMMDGNVDGIDSNDLGVIRNQVIIGNVPKSEPISKEAFQVLTDNPYISTNWLKKTQGGYYGEIGYPNPMDFTDEVASKIKRIDRELLRELNEYRDYETGDLEELTSRMVNALTEDLMDWFVKKRDQIGPVTTKSKLERYARLVASFQRDLISIHPFVDGNGRSVRQFALYYPFWLEGLPPPRLTDPDADLYTPLAKWGDQILEGMENSMKLYESLSKRLDLDLPLETTPELFVPNIPNKISIHKRILKPRKLIKDYKMEEVRPSQFSEYIFERLQDEDIYNEYLNSPYVLLKKLTDEFEKFYQTSRLDYLHPKFGEEKLQLGLVTPDFAHMFGNKSYKSIEKWKYKMNRWYDDSILWRGLSSQDTATSEKEILSMFTDINDHFVSNGNIGRSGNKIELAKKEFEKYNEDVVSGGLVQMAKDHSESGPLYGESYGYSTSRKRSVGKAFAMGAMVIAEYGDHQNYQHLLKSRVLVGMKKSIKDVDLARLKQMRPEFSYIYPRQREVMGVGATDPDAVMVIQTIDEAGEVILSYVRNAKKPNEILVFDQEVNEISSIGKRPIRRIQLD
ncbi:Fic family protein [Halobacteriovorax sp. HLS]|uniref:Fic family protein n=1 Tax=Halobacteriovorax sp. HLS TaxID=2234000 RepID=UPI000FD71C45|nr:Fic family protein [Halobacteriovorax sp. HLS]